MTTASHRPQGPKTFHRVLGLLLLGAVLVYLILIVCVPLRPDRRLGGTELILLLATSVAIAAVLQPDQFAQWSARVSKIAFGRLVVELRDRVDQQKRELEDMKLILYMLVGTDQREHLKRLAVGGYRHSRSNTLRDQLRELAKMQLIERWAGRRIREIERDAKNPENDKQELEVNSIVFLTERGRSYVERLIEIERRGAQEQEQNPMPSPFGNMRTDVPAASE